MSFEIEKIAQLARIKLSEEETQKLGSDLNAILQYIEQLGRIPTDGVEPTSHVFNLENVFRKDEVKPVNVRDKALEHAPLRESFFFKVPKVVDKES
ncbi:MAG: Asp-tRNA(Asn)/Glu-tRNA(Gln) amidotransferase subunit GatC [Candidatus Omnitrophica bacterium]|nr:Asp-tRNA(Asn)/Glu-tRNA(Gln) amidotransferase subunit GatC [Candidatus Omnitrophota bacterium]